MSLNAVSALQPKECPVCMDAFDVDVHLPKVFGCGHSVCAVCVHGCLNRCIDCGGSHEAKCPICRQETLISEDGLPTNFDLRDMIQSLRSVSEELRARCADCNERVPSSKAFACKTCSTQWAIVVCAFCAIKAHRQHELVENDRMATLADMAEASSKVDAGLRALKRRVDRIHSESRSLKKAVEQFVKDVRDALARLKAATFACKVFTKEDVDGYEEKSSNMLQEANAVFDRVDSAFADIYRELSTVDETPTSVSIRVQAAPGNSVTAGGPASSDRLFQAYTVLSSCVALVKEASQKLKGPQKR